MPDQRQESARFARLKVLKMYLSTGNYNRIFHVVIRSNSILSIMKLKRKTFQKLNLFQVLVDLVYKPHRHIFGIYIGNPVLSAHSVHDPL